MAEVLSLEQERDFLRKRNAAKLAAIGVLSARNTLYQAVVQDAPSKVAPRKPRARRPNSNAHYPPRRSARLAELEPTVYKDAPSLSSEDDMVSRCSLCLGPGNAWRILI
jgi:hypothetical protein